jgi:hypothetical protein
MHKGGTRTILLCTVAVLTALSLNVSPQTVGNLIHCPGVAPQPANWVVRVECNPSGQPLYIEHKWPFESPGNIKSIRVPWGYRHLLFGPSIGAQLTNNGHQPSLERGYGEAFVWAMLPGVTPHDKRKPPLTGSDVEVGLLTAQISPPGPTLGIFWDEKTWISRLTPILVDQLKRGPSYPPFGTGYREMALVQKEPRFGLNRIGPERVIVDPTYDRDPFKPGPPPYNDLWFEGDSPEISGALIICGSDYRRNGERDPENNPRTLCHHEFAHPGLNASVRLTYWKINLSHWRDIQIRVVTLLDTFKTNIKPGN